MTTNNRVVYIVYTTNILFDYVTVTLGWFSVRPKTSQASQTVQ